ncbi:MAG: THUMP domain-containing protein [Armatimonadia bacterium]
MALYYLSHIGGLQDIVAEEVRERLPGARLLFSEFGRQHLSYDGDPSLLLTLRTIENAIVLMREVEGVRPGVEGLDELEAALAATDLRPAVEAVRRVRPVGEPPRFRVTAERTGTHEFTSQQAAGFAGAGIIAATGWPVDLVDYEIEVLLEIREDRALVGVRLSETALHKRSRVVHPRVTLNPTLAAAMVRVSEPAPGQIVVDPLCGGGTILIERHAYDRDVTLIGADLFAEKVAIARQNLEAFGIPALLLQANSRRLPLRDETVDRFISNPPWGNLVGGKQLNRRLYPWMLGHMRRCLKPGGLIVLLTSERRLVRRFVEKYEDIRQLSMRRLSVGGLAPSLYVLRKV